MNVKKIFHARTAEKLAELRADIVESAKETMRVKKHDLSSGSWSGSSPGTMGHAQVMGHLDGLRQATNLTLQRIDKELAEAFTADVVVWNIQ